MWMWIVALWGCDAGVTFDEDVAAAAMVAPEGSLGAAGAMVPLDGRPDREAEEARLAAARAAARAAQRPTVVVPQDQRQREWSWEFEYKGPTETQHLRDNPSLEEGQAIERQQAIALGEWEGDD